MLAISFASSALVCGLCDR